jgi:serine/threonine-protein kinase
MECEYHVDRVDVVLTWIPGIPLHDYLKNIRAGKRPPPDPAEALRLIYGLASAVCRLHHQCQVTHGDIQPINVVLTSHTSRLVLIDFGSAWVQQQAATRLEGDGLNPAYSAPEMQISPYQGGFHADQFSVSVMLFELLTQEIPYQGLGGRAGVNAITQNKPVAFRAPSELSVACQRLPESLRRELDALTQRGLALRAADRFPDRHTWLQKLFEVSAQFRLPPRLSWWDRSLVRLAQWWVQGRA